MINVTLGEVEPQEKFFPKLMKGKKDNDVVLFYSEKTGIVIHKDSAASAFYSFGSYRTDWVMSAFVDYNEPITLQNA
jgi:hypothetical protein